MLGFLTCCLYVVMNTGQAAVIPGPVTSTCLNCICKVATTNCVDVRCAYNRGDIACGYYQIKYLYYIDCGTPKPESGCDGLTDEECWMKCSSDKKCAESCIQAYMLRYRNKNGAGENCESYARLHGGGPFGADTTRMAWYNRTSQYWNAVQAYGCFANS